MVRILISSLLIINCIGYVLARDLEIRIDDKVITEGETIEVSSWVNFDDSWSVDAFLEIANTSNVDKEVMIEASLAEGAELVENSIISFCSFGLAFSGWKLPEPEVIKAGQTIGEDRWTDPCSYSYHPDMTLEYLPSVTINCTITDVSVDESVSFSIKFIPLDEPSGVDDYTFEVVGSFSELKKGENPMAFLVSDGDTIVVETSTQETKFYWAVKNISKWSNTVSAVLLKSGPVLIDSLDDQASSMKKDESPMVLIPPQDLRVGDSIGYSYKIGNDNFAFYVSGYAFSYEPQPEVNEAYVANIAVIGSYIKDTVSFTLMYVPETDSVGGENLPVLSIKGSDEELLQGNTNPAAFNIMDGDTVSISSEDEIMNFYWAVKNESNRTVQMSVEMECMRNGLKFNPFKLLSVQGLTKGSYNFYEIAPGDSVGYGYQVNQGGSIFTESGFHFSYTPTDKDYDPIYVNVNVVDNTNNDTIRFVVVFSPVEESASTDKIEQSVQIHVYPNPAVDFVWFRFGCSMKGKELYITDVRGRLVRSIHLSEELELSISLRDLASGLYFYNISDNGVQIFSGKLFVS